MAISLQSLRKVRADQPPRLLIYGPEGMGKTSAAASFPAPVFLQTEKGEAASLELDSFGHLTTYESVIEAIAALASEDHSFKTVVLDGVSSLEKLIWNKVCRDGNVKSIEEYDKGFGKGYVAADAYWNEVVDGLNHLRTERGMMVVLLGHSIITKFEDPETETYSVYSIDLQKRANAILKREVDAILLVKKDVTIKHDDEKKNEGRARASGGDARWFFTEGRPAFTAKNRYDMPARIMFPKGGAFEALGQYFPAVGAAGSETSAQAA